MLQYVEIRMSTAAAQIGLHDELVGRRLLRGQNTHISTPMHLQLRSKRRQAQLLQVRMLCQTQRPTAPKRRSTLRRILIAKSSTWRRPLKAEEGGH
jgi:hypothetical protein